MGGRGLKRGEEGDTLVRMQKQENKKSLKKEFRLSSSWKVGGMVKKINIHYHLNNICKHRVT